MHLAIIILTFFIVLLLESTLLNFPLVLVMHIVYFVRNKVSEVFISALFWGLLLDILNVRRIGLSSTYILIVLFLILLYDRKYTINTLQFILISTFVASSGFVWLMQSPEPFVSVITATLTSGIIFILLRRLRFST